MTASWSGPKLLVRQIGMRHRVLPLLQDCEGVVHGGQPSPMRAELTSCSDCFVSWNVVSTASSAISVEDVISLAWHPKLFTARSYGTRAFSILLAGGAIL